MCVSPALPWLLLCLVEEHLQKSSAHPRSTTKLISLILNSWVPELFSEGKFPPAELPLLLLIVLEQCQGTFTQNQDPALGCPWGGAGDEIKSLTILPITLLPELSHHITSIFLTTLYTNFENLIII